MQTQPPQQPHARHSLRTLPALHQGISPVAACDLVRGLARLGLRHPHLYSAACVVVARGLISDLDAWGSMRPLGTPHDGLAGWVRPSEVRAESAPRASHSLETVEQQPAGPWGGWGVSAVAAWQGGLATPRAGEGGSAAAALALEAGGAGGSGAEGGGASGLRSGGDGGGGGSRDAWGAGVWVGSGGSAGMGVPSGLSVWGLVDLLGALALVQHHDALLLDLVAQRLAVELD